MRGGGGVAPRRGSRAHPLLAAHLFMNPINGFYEASARTHSPRPSPPPAAALHRFSYDMASTDLLPGAMSQEEVQEVTETQSSAADAKRAAARQRAAARAAEALEEYVLACRPRYADR